MVRPGFSVNEVFSHALPKSHASNPPNLQTFVSSPVLRSGIDDNLPRQRPRSSSSGADRIPDNPNNKEQPGRQEHEEDNRPPISKNRIAKRPGIPGTFNPGDTRTRKQVTYIIVIINHSIAWRN
ncbi:hypothetical protein Bbelb_161370 [Branchiostoma belcheri]|nr:hypothetical protein Bbelb_161370 [Branchiostoma belcheri]